MSRLVLAATLGASYGIYGPAFELLENRPRHPGSEEYLDSEKYRNPRPGICITVRTSSSSSRW
jgi:hypothetical protein